MGEFVSEIVHRDLSVSQFSSVVRDPFLLFIDIFSVNKFSVNKFPSAYQFLDAFSHLYKRVCLSVRPSVVPSVGPSVTHELNF